MSSNQQIIDKLNKIRATEQRMALIYRRAAQMVTGPYRNSLIEEFEDHAEEEDEHASRVMKRIMAMGGTLHEDVAVIPPWKNLDELLEGLEDLEKEGIESWQELHRMLPENDAFRHYIEEALSTEQEHYDDVKQWRRKDYAEKSMTDYYQRKPLNWDYIVPEYSEYKVKKSLNCYVDSHSRAGTPPTRRGSFNGAPSGLLPNTQVGESLVVKALGVPQIPRRLPDQVPGQSPSGPMGQVPGSMPGHGPSPGQSPSDPMGQVPGSMPGHGPNPAATPPGPEPGMPQFPGHDPQISVPPMPGIQSPSAQAQNAFQSHNPMAQQLQRQPPMLGDAAGVQDRAMQPGPGPMHQQQNRVNQPNPPQPGMPPGVYPPGQLDEDSDERHGPKPGMIHTQTQRPEGPQTETGSAPNKMMNFLDSMKR